MLSVVSLEVSAINGILYKCALDFSPLRAIHNSAYGLSATPGLPALNPDPLHHAHGR